MNENLKKLYGIFGAVLGIDASKITSNLSPKTCPTWDSFNAIVLISEIENAFKIHFEYNEAMAVKNMADVTALVRKKGVTI